MHTTIDYSKIPEGAREIAALNDLREYLGDARYSELVKGCKPTNRKYIQGILEIIAGAQGYPVQCFLDMYCGVEG